MLIHTVCSLVSRRWVEVQGGPGGAGHRAAGGHHSGQHGRPPRHRARSVTPAACNNTHSHITHYGLCTDTNCIAQQNHLSYIRDKFTIVVGINSSCSRRRGTVSAGNYSNWTHLWGSFCNILEGSGVINTSELTI